jgi:hypothetical protein
MRDSNDGDDECKPVLIYVGCDIGCAENGFCLLTIAGYLALLLFALLL